jgi:hypothetical protein
MMKKKRVEPLGRSMKELDDLFTDGGGIFDTAARVAFKEKSKPAPKIKVPGVKGPQVLTDKELARIKKLEALAADPGASEGEKATAREKIRRIKGGK